MKINKFRFFVLILSWTRQLRSTPLGDGIPKKLYLADNKHLFLAFGKLASHSTLLLLAKLFFFFPSARLLLLLFSFSICQWEGLLLRSTCLSRTLLCVSQLEPESERKNRKVQTSSIVYFRLQFDRNGNTERRPTSNDDVMLAAEWEEQENWIEPKQPQCLMEVNHQSRFTIFLLYCELSFFVAMRQKKVKAWKRRNKFPISWQSPLTHSHTHRTTPHQFSLAGVFRSRLFYDYFLFLDRLLYNTFHVVNVACASSAR